MARSDSLSFQERFCAFYSCGEESFLNESLSRVIEYRGLALARVLWRIRPGFFRTDLEVLRGLGSECDRTAIVSKACHLDREYRRRNDFGFIREQLLVRLSTNRLLLLLCRIWPNPESGAERSGFHPDRVISYKSHCAFQERHTAIAGRLGARRRRFFF